MQLQDGQQSQGSHQAGGQYPGQCITLTQLPWALPQEGLLRELQDMVAKVVSTELPQGQSARSQRCVQVTQGSSTRPENRRWKTEDIKALCATAEPGDGTGARHGELRPSLISSPLTPGELRTNQEFL